MANESWYLITHGVANKEWFDFDSSKLAQQYLENLTQSPTLVYSQQEPLQFPKKNLIYV